MRQLSCFLAVPLLLAACGHAAAQCGIKSPNVEKYLRDHPRWSMVEVRDLPSDDELLWDGNHNGLCPGMAVVNLDGSGKSYALALLRKTNGTLSEMLVLLTVSNDHLIERMLVKPTQVISPFVVWRVGPGKYFDQDNGKNVSIEHDSIVYEKIESTSRQFYFLNGEMHSFLASD